MDLTRHVDGVRQQLEVAADAGGEQSQALASRLTAPLESALRLVLLEALSEAASEITMELAPASVEVRLRGRDPEFVVSDPRLGRELDDAAEHAPPPVPIGAEEAEDGAVSRSTIRLPEHLKQRVDQAAARHGLSVNAWLIRAVSDALRSDAVGPAPARRDPGQQSFTGWVR